MLPLRNSDALQQALGLVSFVARPIMMVVVPSSLVPDVRMDLVSFVLCLSIQWILPGRGKLVAVHGDAVSDEESEDSAEPDPLLQAIDLESVPSESPSLASLCPRPEPEQMIIPASRQVSSSSLASKARVAPSALNQLRLRGIERLRTQLSATCSTSLVTMDQIANVLANYADDAPLTV
jgi:hypothetical protein